MVKGVDGRLRIAWHALIAAAVLFAANWGYGLAHEAAHAAVIEAMGGQVYAIYVNALGTDAYTCHTSVCGMADLVLVNAAGLCMTTLLALAFAVAGQGLLATFLAARTAIYALNYSPGADMSTIQAVVGSPSMLLSLLLVAVNLSCICLMIRNKPTSIASAGKKLTACLFSSLSRARPVRSN